MNAPTIITGSDEWHAERRLGIGGSDCAAVMGLSRWSTPLGIYREKLGEAEPQDETWDQARGKALEPLLRQHYAQTTGREVQTAPSVVHPKYPFMRYNPDGLTDGRLIELKTARFGQGWGEDGTDDVPQEYLLQVQHGMAVTGLPIADVTVSIAGNAPRYFQVEADIELQQMIIETEAAFWDRVQRRDPPPPITRADVVTLHGRYSAERIVQATDEQIDAHARIKAIRAQIKALEAQDEALCVALMSAIGTADTLAVGDMRLATWKTSKAPMRLDGAALLKEMPGVHAAYLKPGKPSRPLLIK